MYLTLILTPPTLPVAGGRLGGPTFLSGGKVGGGRPGSPDWQPPRPHSPFQPG